MSDRIPKRTKKDENWEETGDEQEMEIISKTHRKML